MDVTFFREFFHCPGISITPPGEKITRLPRSCDSGFLLSDWDADMRFIQ